MELLPAFLESAPDPSEVAHILQDILPARSLVLEFATRLAVQRANQADIERLRDITELLIPAFERGDQVVIGHGFQRWLEALIDAGHSIAVRWIANPFLEAYRDVLDRFPALWVLEPSFPQHLRDFIGALDAGDEARAIEVTRTYYKRVDAAFAKAIEGALGDRVSSRGSSEESAEARRKRRSERP
jgi:DNA-binding GntR family transcriptional regulator